jgi:hypothetical protein
MWKQTVGESPVALTVVCCLALVCGLAGAAFAQSWPEPEVLLEVRPNERGDGTSGGAAGSQMLGAAPWSKPVAGPVGPYWWQRYRFGTTSGLLWIQVCAQNWSKSQNGGTDDDGTLLWIDGFGMPTDWDGIQNGPPGGWQWVGDIEAGQRWTLRFLSPGPSGLQSIRIGADETPVVWWVKVTDLEPGVIFPP